MSCLLREPGTGSDRSQPHMTRLHVIPAQGGNCGHKGPPRTQAGVYQNRIVAFHSDGQSCKLHKVTAVITGTSDKLLRFVKTSEPQQEADDVKPVVIGDT